MGAFFLFFKNGYGIMFFMDISQNDVFNSFSAPSGSFDGGMVVDGPAQVPRRNKWWILIIVAVLLVGVVALVIWIGARGGNNGFPNSNKTKLAFNKYTNYILDGEDKETDVTREMIDDSTPYFDDLSNSAEKKQYLEKETALYDAFYELYDSDMRNEELSAIKLYYHDYLEVDRLSTEELAEVYREYGEKDVEDLIAVRYNMVNINQALGTYVDTLKELANVQLKVIVEMDKAGCLGVENCFKMKEDDEFDIYSLETKSAGIVYDLWDGAQEALIGVYNVVYGEGR